MRHELHEIINGTTANLVHILNGVAMYHINVKGTIYSWEIETNNTRYYNHHFTPELHPAEYTVWIKYAMSIKLFQQIN
jgi:hypothetical protein